MTPAFGENGRRVCQQSNHAVQSRSSVLEANARRPRSVSSSARRGFSPPRNTRRGRGGRPDQVRGGRRSPSTSSSVRLAHPGLAAGVDLSRRPPRAELVAGPRTETSRWSETAVVATDRGVEPDVNVEATAGDRRGLRAPSLVLWCGMEALAIVTAVTSALAAAGALFNGWQIARLAGRVDALATDVRAINTRIDNILLADRRT